MCVCVWMELRSSHGVRLFVCSRWKVIFSHSYSLVMQHNNKQLERNERRDAPVGHFHSQELRDTENDLNIQIKNKTQE